MEGMCDREVSEMLQYDDGYKNASKKLAFYFSKL